MDANTFARARGFAPALTERGGLNGESRGFLDGLSLWGVTGAAGSLPPSPPAAPPAPPSPPPADRAPADPPSPWVTPVAPPRESTMGPPPPLNVLLVLPPLPVLLPRVPLPLSPLAARPPCRPADPLFGVRLPPPLAVVVGCGGEPKTVLPLLLLRLAVLIWRMLCGR